MLHQFSNGIAVAHLLDAIDLSSQIGSRKDVVQVHGVVNIEDQRIGTTLGTRPERLTTGGDLIRREVKEQLLDLVSILVLPVETSPLDALGEVLGLVVDKGFLYIQKNK